jgi:Zn-dependent peptidase ImmA (M78 family)
MSAEFVAHNFVPAFSNLSMASTYISAELIFSDRDTDMKFLALTRLTGIERLQWVLAHEYGHIICQTHEERKANHAGDYLLRGQIGTCN